MSDMAATWPDRRVSTGYETAEELAKHYNLLNWRGHPESQRDATEESLDALGYVGAIKKSVQSGVILDGHLRIEIALAKDPAMRLPVDYYDLSPDEEALALQVLDATTEMAEPIPDKLAALLERTREMTADRPGLGAMLERLRERAGINGNGHQVTEDEPQIDKAAELQKVWGTQVGQIWQLGNHRLAVGDCTDRATVEAVMGGEDAQTVITDPPYGINMDTDYTKISGGNFQTDKRNNHKPIEGDSRPFDPSHLMHFENVVLWGANCFPQHLKMGTFLVWDKRNAEGRTLFSDGEIGWLSRGHGCYIFSHKWDGLNRESEHGEHFHPTQKPTALWRWVLSEHLPFADSVYDPYLGAGGVLLACEQLGRRCRAIEIDPGYAAVSIQRWVDLTGIEPHRLT